MPVAMLSFSRECEQSEPSSSCFCGKHFTHGVIILAPAVSGFLSTRSFCPSRASDRGGGRQFQPPGSPRSPAGLCFVSAWTLFQRTTHTAVVEGQTWALVPYRPRFKFCFQTPYVIFGHLATLLFSEPLGFLFVSSSFSSEACLNTDKLNRRLTCAIGCYVLSTVPGV